MRRLPRGYSPREYVKANSAVVPPWVIAGKECKISNFLQKRFSTTATTAVSHPVCEAALRVDVSKANDDNIPLAAKGEPVRRRDDKIGPSLFPGAVEVVRFGALRSAGNELCGDELASVARQLGRRLVIELVIDMKYVSSWGVEVESGQPDVTSDFGR